MACNMSASLGSDNHTKLKMPLRIGGLSCKNRFLVQPMECCDANPDGTPSPRTFQRYAKYCQGGAGIVVIESVTLQYESRSTEHQLMIDIHNANNRKAWTDFFQQLKDLYPDTLLLVQFNHAGEYASDVFSKRFTPKQKPGFEGELMDEAYVDGVIQSFVDTAVFLAGTKCDGVDLKFSHGYLGTQLLRPYNDRNWKYGGSWENRSRFAFQIIEDIRRQVPSHNFLLGAKVSMYEGIAQGFGSDADNQIDMLEPILLCKGLEARGADFIIESLGAAQETWDLMAPSLKNPNVLKLHMAACQSLKSELSPRTVVICSGMTILGPRYAEVAGLSIRKGIFDMGSIGRQVFADPAFCNKVMAGDLDSINYCKLCDGCGELLIHQKPAWCIYNPLD